MSSSSAGPRILVKARSGLTANRLAVGDARIGFSVEPLFRSIGAGSQGVAPAATWQLLTPDADTDINPWDACHVLLQQGLGVTGGGGVEFAEPDLAQRWRTGDERDPSGCLYRRLNSGSDTRQNEVTANSGCPCRKSNTNILMV